MLFHCKKDENSVVTCSEKVHVDLTVFFSMQGHGVLNQKGYLITRLAFEQLVDDSELIPRYHCYRCRTIVPEEELVAECTHCFQHFPLDDLSIIEEVSGVYCEDGIEQMKSEFTEETPITSISKLITQMDIKST